MTKFTKEEVIYSRGMMHSHCGKVFLFDDDKGYCQHFIDRGGVGDGLCKLVEGPINRVYWCKEFEKVKI